MTALSIFMAVGTVAMFYFIFKDLRDIANCDPTETFKTEDE